MPLFCPSTIALPPSSLASFPSLLAPSSAPDCALDGLYWVPFQLFLLSSCTLLPNYPLLPATSYFLVTSSPNFPALPLDDSPTLLVPRPRVMFPVTSFAHPLGIVHLVSPGTVMPFVLVSLPFFPHPLPPVYRCAPLSINSCLLSPVWYLLP